MIGAKEARALFSKTVEERYLKSACEAWMEDNLDSKIRKSSQNGFSSIKVEVPYEYKDYCSTALSNLGYYVRASGPDFNNGKKVLNFYISW